jgi:hypothetical protein
LRECKIFCCCFLNIGVVHFTNLLVKVLFYSLSTARGCFEASE